MRKLAVLIFICLMLILGAIIWNYFDHNGGGWVCTNGEWVKSGKTDEPMPAGGCSRQPDNIPNPAPAETMIEVDWPKPNEIISSPLEISGHARGSWYFEASFPVTLLDDQGVAVARGIAQAQGDWMTPEFVPFIARLEFTGVTATSGSLVLEKDNPSGLPENADEIRIPVIIKEEKKTAVKVFFGNNKIDPNALECGKVYPATRLVVPTEAIARAALAELLKGVTEPEQEQGFNTSINPGVTIQNLTIANGIATVDFSQGLADAVGGSCRVTAIRAQITETLKQFDTVKEVVISIDGRTDDILQP